MAQGVLRKQYGDTTISGNAVVQMGDGQLINRNEVNIHTAYLFLQDELDLPKLNIAQALPSLSLDEARRSSEMSRQHQVFPQTKCHYRKEEGITITQQDVPFSNAIHLSESFAPQTGFQTASGHTSDKESVRLQTLKRRHHFSAASDRQDDDAIEENNSLYSCTRRKPISPKVHNTAMVIHSSQELLALFVFVFSFLIGRNASPQEISSFITKCQHDSLLPILTATLAFGIARYFYTGRVVMNPSAMDELKIGLEDAYGTPTVVSMSICADYTIFKSFLEVHYKKAGRKAGEILVKADQFHLMLGSRRGMLVDADNWAIEPGSNIINSLYVTTEEQKCLLCKSNLVVSKTGDLHW